MRILFFMAVLTGLMWASPVRAQEAVQVRANGHKDYSRLVFDWAAETQYSVSKESNRVLVRFGKKAEPDLSGVSADAKNIVKVEKISTGGEPLQMAITIPQGSRFRDFQVGSKLIIDVYNPPGSAQKAPAPEPEKQESVAKAEKEAQVPAVKTQSAPAPVAEPAPVSKADVVAPDVTVTTEQAEAIPAPNVEEPAPVATPAIDAHVITLTTTASTGMSAFLRSGYLWLVFDNPDLTVSPQIAGPQKTRFPDFAKIDADGGVAYRLDLPMDMNVYGEGGGLSWRVVLSPADKPASSKDAVQKEGSLVWPLTGMRKEIKFKDPDIGDTITVITAIQADQYTRGPKDFVELRQLDSVVGLAYVAKTDDIRAEILPDQVKVGAPDGLVLSSAEDVKTQEIRAATASNADEVLGEAPPPVTDAKTPEDLNKAAAEKPKGNNIYNFSSWEMGGLAALNGNMHAIMMETAGKSDAEKTEDILTMAKVNLANDRGPEALGLLRVARGFVPDLENNAEFKALRGAASALSGKFDLAFNDFTETDLHKYDDVKYWRAYTLAGLEDWKQAIEIMPPGFDTIAAYPQQIRVPLALSFAEISLRAGKIPQAEGILGMIQPDLEKLPPQYQASWAYLMGEAQRQLGNAQKAEDYWKPLVEGGKDHLFRAKAGLSLTKLQLDRKQLKPAEAIDRLEGLRYAWRGDELETLINYRLGQMYVENKEFLKGLTVLRNAVSLSPGSELSREITDYMTRTFRDVFANDRLKDVSPLDAISLYEEFKELTPAGEQGDRFVEKLAERLVQSDLLGRAASLLEYQVNHRLQGDKKAEIAIRLAAIRLLDGNPDGALRSLEIAQSVLNGVEPSASAAPETPQEETAEGETAPAKPLTNDSEKQRQVDLLKARALSMKDKTDEAMAILEKMRLDPDVNRLRADIAWDAGRWEDAAMALNDLMLSEDMSPRKALTPYQADLIMNRGIALNLSNNRVALANLRQRYKVQMDKTDKAKLFDVVSRPRRPDMIGSRESIERMISEISLFQGFLDTYGKMVPETKPAETTPETAPAEDAEPVAKENGGTAEAPAAE